MTDSVSSIPLADSAGILNSFPTAIIYTDSELVIKYVNAAFVDFFGYSFEEAQGAKLMAFFADKHALSAQGLLPPKKMIGRKTYDITYIHKNRSTFTGLTLCATVEKPEAQKGYVFSIQDIQQQDRLLMSLRFQLADQVALTARIQEELQQFAYIASHDLQEPLRKILAFSDRLRTKVEKALDPAGIDYLDRLQNATSRMQNLIDDLLIFSRISTHGRPLVLVNLTAIVENVIKNWQHRIEKANALITVNSLPKIEADAGQMRQLFQNLIGNALKFRRSEAPLQITISASEDALNNASGRQMCQIIVTDNGIGFDEKYLDRIFTLFKRLHSKKDYPGTGMGLAVCKKIVERHGGRITASSTPGDGAAFRIFLPLYQNGEDT